MKVPLCILLSCLMFGAFCGCSQIKDERTCTFVEKIGPVDEALVGIITRLMDLESGWYSVAHRRENAQRLFILLDELDELRKYYIDETEDLVTDKVEDLNTLMLKKIDDTIALGEFFELKFTEWLAEDVPKEEIKKCLEKFGSFRWKFKRHQDEMRRIYNKIQVYILLCD